jgi:UDP-GlcNAc:undecaprenyl-phosphate/decaprenyl-phosphate GlcNAc-1-phosphate transferase
MTDRTRFLIAFVATLLLAAGFTRVARNLSWRWRCLAYPKADRWNRKAVPLLGGVAVWAATLLVTAALTSITPRLIIILAASTVLLGVGIVDDLITIKPSSKLSAQLVVACAVVAAGMGLQGTPSTAANGLATIAWLVAITNAFNLLDNMDGVCAGVAAIAATAFCAIVNGSAGDLFVLSACVSGAAVGFLLFNFPPASIFLGDAGSFFLGAIFGLLALAWTPVARTGLISTLAVPLLVLLLPIFDTVFVTVARKLSARAASRGGRDHPSHRLVALGFSERQTVLMMYLLAGAGGAVAWGVSRANHEALGIGSLLLLSLGLFATQLARVRVYDGHDFAVLRGKPFTPLLLEITYKRRLFEVLLDTCLVAIAYYLAYVLRFSDDFSRFYPFFVQSLPVVIACQVTGLFVAGVYRGIWRHITTTDLPTYGLGVGLGWLASILGVVYAYRFEGYSRSVFIIDALLLLVFLVAARVAFRWLGHSPGRRFKKGRRTLIYGAGAGGLLLARELKENAVHDCDPVGFLDDDRSMVGRQVLGIPVLGGIEKLDAVLHSHPAELLIVSTRTLRPEVRQQLLDVCASRQVALSRFDFRLDLPLADAEVPVEAGREVASQG